MDEALILEKLDNLSNEVRSLKSGVLEELRQDLLPIVKQTGPLMSECLTSLEEGHKKEDVAYLLQNLVANVENLNSLLNVVKGGMELTEEIEPMAKLALPKTIEFFGEMEDQFDGEELAALMRNTFGNLQHFNTAITMLKAGMELKDEIEPMAKLALPRVTEFFDELDDQVDYEELLVLMRNSLGNLEHFNTAITMLKAGMELKDEVEPMAKLALPKAIDFFDEIGGLLKVAGTAMQSLKGAGCSDAQAEAMSEVIRTIDLSQAEKIGPIALVKKLGDPKIQESLGAIFMFLEVFGSLLQAYKNPAGNR